MSNPVVSQNPTPPPPTPDQVLGMTSDQFVEAFRGRFIVDGEGGKVGAMRAYHKLMRDGDTDVVAAGSVEIRRPEIGTVLREPCLEGELVKFTQRVPGVAGKFGELATESVLIPMVGRSGSLTHTLCVSSQIGCAMGCTFCETAQMGLIRHLSAAEIVSQWWAATHVLGKRPSNVVFMGMGEPMDNLDNVLAAVAVLKDHHGPALPISKVTISTVGRVDGIRRLGEKLHEPGWHRLNLAISLNAPNDTVRDEIMPINRKYDLAELQKSLLAFPIYGGGKLCVEYVLIPGVNDRAEHAKEVAEFFEPINRHYQEDTRRGSVRAMINLIPYNPRRNSPWPAPTEESVDDFMRWLTERGIFTKRRRTKGRELMGACGQLGSAEIRQRKLVDVSVGGEAQRALE
ncbi:MAG: 23S rRNA (adenine(2503)-C(2))-methyltransferase RlmN [Planctomycetota bacterium]